MNTLIRVFSAIIAAVFVLRAFGATISVPLDEGWRFVKADDPSAPSNLTIQAISGGASI